MLADASRASPDVRRLAELHAAAKEGLAGTSLAIETVELAAKLYADVVAAADKHALEAKVRRPPDTW